MEMDWGKKWTLARILLLIWPFAVTLLLWRFHDVKPLNLDFSARNIVGIPWLETSWAYAFIHLFSVVPVFLLSFDKKVHFYTYWSALLPAILIMATWFIIWDAFFGYIGVWGFNDTYLTGPRLIGLPWEEWMFFITVPFASFFIFICLNTYFPKDTFKQWDSLVTIGLVFFLLLFGIMNLNKLYTSTTFFLTAGFLLYHYIYIENTYRTLFYRAFIVVLIPFLLTNGLLTGMFTNEPVVVYNPEEFIGVRIITIPLEDSVYGFLLTFGVVFWYTKRAELEVKGYKIKNAK